MNRRTTIGLLLAILLSMTSCIGVQDYGSAWDSAVVDKALAGSWKQISARPDQTRAQGYGIGVITTYVEKAGAYEVTMYDAEVKASDDRPMYPIKTLSIGAYRFIATPAPHGIIERYTVRGNTLEMCMGIGPTQVEFQREKYPNAINIGKNHSEGEFLEVQLLDDEAMKIIAAIPATSDYWDCDWKYQRVSSWTGGQ